MPELKENSAPAEPWLWEQLGSPVSQRHDEIDCRFTACAALVLDHATRYRAVHVTIEDPKHANPMVDAIRAFRLGKNGAPSRDGTLIFPDILHDEISEDLTNHYLNKMTEVEGEADPDYEASDYLYVVHSVEGTDNRFVKSDSQPTSSNATEELVGSLIHGAGQPEKPMLVVVSDEPWIHVRTSENDSLTRANSLARRTNYGIVISELGLAHSFLDDPDYVDASELQKPNR